MGTHTHALSPNTLPPEPYNLLSAALLLAFLGWVLTAIWRFMRAVQLKRATESGRVVNVEGLGSRLEALTGITRSHLDAIAHACQVSPPSSVPRLSLPAYIRLTNVSPVDVGGDGAYMRLGVSFTVDAQAPCTVQLFWGVDWAKVWAMYQSEGAPTSTGSRFSFPRSAPQSLSPLGRGRLQGYFRGTQGDSSRESSTTGDDLQMSGTELVARRALTSSSGGGGGRGRGLSLSPLSPLRAMRAMVNNNGNTEINHGGENSHNERSTGVSVNHVAAPGEGAGAPIGESSTSSANQSFSSINPIGAVSSSGLSSSLWSSPSCHIDRSAALLSCLQASSVASSSVRRLPPAIGQPYRPGTQDDAVDTDRLREHILRHAMQETAPDSPPPPPLVPLVIAIKPETGVTSYGAPGVLLTFTSFSRIGGGALSGGPGIGCLHTPAPAPSNNPRSTPTVTPSPQRPPTHTHDTHTHTHDTHTSSPSSPSQQAPGAHVHQQLCQLGKDLYTCHEVFGLDDTNQPECVICLTEGKDAILLPCRHMCVCRMCLHFINKCPVCRSPFEKYLVYADPAQGDVEGGDSELQPGSGAAI